MARAPHWRVPSLILGSLVCGVILAVTQHLFYSWLNGRATDSTITPISQNFAVGIGTALAFLVKACFVLCVSLTYTQAVWIRLLSKEVRVADIDDLHNALTDVTAIFHVRLWVSNPIALVAMILAW